MWEKNHQSFNNTQNRYFQKRVKDNQGSGEIFEMKYLLPQNFAIRDPLITL